jgi:stress response protein YsnF
MTVLERVAVEMTARGEEAMVDKEARVVEEVVVGKTTDEQVCVIEDTVRRTQVEVDEEPGKSNRGTTGLFGGTNRKTDY